MNQEPFQLVTVASGALSLHSVEHDETFHPVIGPAAEAADLHVAPQRLVERIRSRGSGKPFIIWDVGLGAGGNALGVLDAIEGLQTACAVQIHSFDRSLLPIRFAIDHAQALGYFSGRVAAVEQLVAQRQVTLEPVEWLLHEGDFRDFVRSPRIPSPDAVLFDPYSPAANPELWTLDTFAAIRARVPDTETCLLTTYSRSTAVRVTLLLAGWFVGRGVGIGEKTETTLASSRFEELPDPLDRRWLARVSRSTAAAPLLGPGRNFSGCAFSEVSAHPQFHQAR